MGLSAMMFPVSLCLLTPWLSLSAGDEVTRSEEAIVRSLFVDYAEQKKHVRPPTNTSVHFGVGINSILELNDRTGLLRANYWLRLKWSDPRLAWTNQSIAEVTVPIDKIWTPDIALWNGLDRIMVVSYKSYPVIFQNGDVLWIPHSTLSTTCSPPGDEDGEGGEGGDWDWECSLKFGSWSHNGWKINLFPYGDSLKVDIAHYVPNLYGWEIDAVMGPGVEVNYYDCCPEPYSSITFKMRFKKIPGGVADAATGSASLLSLTATVLSALLAHVVVSTTTH